MGRPLIPAILLKGPFSFQDALATGLTKDHLKSRAWHRLSRGVYCHAAQAGDPRLLLAAIAQHRLPPSAAFGGLTAAYLDCLDPIFPADIEVVVPPGAGVSTRTGLIVRRSPLPEEDVVLRRGLRATTVPRTIADLATHHPLIRAVIYADIALHHRKTNKEELRLRAASMAGRPGVTKFRRVIDLADGRSESPGETQTRLLLVLAGLPCPELQVSLYNSRGEFIARVDLLYPTHRLIIEFDGQNHRDRLVDDNRRQNRLIDAGYHLLRFTWQDLRDHPNSVPEQVRRYLGTIPVL